MRPRTLRVQEMAFWAGVFSGLGIEAAATAIGMAGQTGRRLFREAGGVKPQLEPPVLRLSYEERCLIEAMREVCSTQAAIAARLKRDPGTISRELGRNSSQRGYRARTAQSRADGLARRPKQTKLAGNPRLTQQVQDRLEQEHSPHQIANRLRVDYPDDLEMQVSAETIYKSLFVQGRGELRHDLTKRLRTGRARRKPRHPLGARGNGQGRIPDMVNIAQRPAEVADRAVPGHWEGDLIMGSKASCSAIGTLVERSSRFVVLLHLPDGFGAAAVQAAMLEAISRLPEQLRKTLTWDQGKEMANHVQIAAATDMSIYFCDPHSPWQRGSNENANGLLRQYFPKGTDLSVYQADYLDHVARKLNTRPRMTLDWQTPAETLDALLSNPNGSPDVALTG
jgi:IS30 family transposase